MVSEILSSCLMCRGGKGGEADRPDHRDRRPEDDDPEAARQARIHSQKIDQEIRREHRRRQREVRSAHVLRTSHRL